MLQARNGQGEGRDECVVVLWKGYVTGQFQAYGRESAEPFLCSRPFRMWRPPWQPKLSLDESPGATAAFRSLAVELSRRGWRSAGDARASDRRVFVRPPEPEAEAAPPKIVGPASIAEPFLLRALTQAAGDDGATAAEVGRVLYGDDAPKVRQLPQRIGTRLRQLQLEGKVDRFETNGVSRWYATSPGTTGGAAAR